MNDESIINNANNLSQQGSLLNLINSAKKRKEFWEKKIGGSIYKMPFNVVREIASWDNLIDGEEVAMAGRIIAKRVCGAIAFFKITDHSSEAQLILNKNILKEEYQEIKDNLASGDLVAVSGLINRSNTGEKSIEVKKIQLIGCNQREMPDKWHGMANLDNRYRNSYMVYSNEEEFKRVINLRINLMFHIRQFFHEEGFFEVETPILQHVASGAAAKPFKTHHDALDIDLYLRIAPEMKLKMMIAGGFTRIFEIGKNFRNEGIDPTHLQEFTMLECYAAYWTNVNYIEFTKKLFHYLIEKLKIPKELEFRSHKINLGGTWHIEHFDKLIEKKTGININDETNLKERIIDYLKSQKEDYAQINDIESTMGLVDFLYKKKCRPNIIEPTFMLNYPSYMAPLATIENGKSTKLQLVIAGIEFINAYGELVDPEEQERNFIEQDAHQNNLKIGHDNAEDIFRRDNEFLQSMHYGMPPMAGCGIGIDRLLCLLSGHDNLKNTIFFPLVINH